MMKRSAPLRRTGFKRKPVLARQAKQVDCTPTPRPVARAAVSLPPARAVPKVRRHDSEAWRLAVASLPCMRCGVEGRTQCAHRNEGKGMARKTDDALTAALCDECHSEIDQGRDLTREERRSRIDAAILKTIAELARRGLIAVTS